MSSVSLDDLPAVRFAHRLVDPARIESLLHLVEAALQDPSRSHGAWPEFDRDLVHAGVDRSNHDVLKSLWSGLVSRSAALRKP